MKKITVAALGIAFAFSAVAASAATTYTRDLTIGSTGADVVSLQDTLVAKGFLVIPAGTSKGYFGALTKAALAKYQASAGISPAVGYFGPVTRAHFNAMTDTPSGDDEGDDDEDSGDLQGGEGNIKDFDILGNPSNTDLDEGQTDEVLGFEFEADDSDIRVERLEIVASTSAASPASRDPWDYIESARLMLDGEEVAEVSDLDDEDSWDEEADDAYSFRFEDIDAVVEEGETAKFYVEFTALDNLDSDDEGTEFDIALTDDGLRAVDAEGIDLYEGVDTDEVNVTFEGAEAGDLDLSIDESDNEDRTVFVDEDSETEGVEIMRFTIEANASTNMIDELQVALATTTSTTTDIADVITSLRLEVDGDEISTESVPAGDGVGTTTVTFEDLEDEFEVAEDEEIEVVILADFDSQEGNYGEGYEFRAAVLGAGIDAEDAEGDDVTVSDNIYGGDIEVRVDGIAVELVSTDVNLVLAADPSTTSADVYSYTIKFEVTAEGDDVYIDKSVQATDTPTIAGGGIAWATTSESTTASTQTNAQTFSASGSTSGDTATAFKVSDGSTRTFTLKVTLEATADGSTAVEVAGINWTTDSSDTTADNYYTFALDDFETELQYMNKI